MADVVAAFQKFFNARFMNHDDGSRTLMVVHEAPAAATYIGDVVVDAGTAIIGKVGIDQTTPGTTNGVVPAGNVAAGAADSGNPVKVGGVYNSTLPTLTTGQRGDIALDANSQVRTVNGLIAQGSVDSLANSIVGTMGNRGSTSAAGLHLGTVPYKFNGTSWDRDRKPNATKILPSAAASTNADFAKASAGDLWCISGFNAAASVRYLKVFNKTSAPTVGTDTPVMVIALPVGAFNLNMGAHYFSTGIAFALTTGAALLDTGALTAADIVGLTLTFA